MDKLFEHAEQNGINVFYFRLKNKKAFSVDDNGYKAIALDRRKFSKVRKIKTVLAEEIIHLQYNLTYHLRDFANPLLRQNIEQVEYRTKRKAAALLLPLEELKEALDKNMTIYEIAEEFELETEVVQTAIEYYTVTNKLKNFLENQDIIRS